MVVPLSTIPNWLSELALWAPDLNVVEYLGSATSRTIIREHEFHPETGGTARERNRIYKFHVMVTTFEAVLAEASLLRRISWDVLVVDEGHRLKNEKSKTFVELTEFQTAHRVLLTGTPLQVRQYPRMACVRLCVDVCYGMSACLGISKFPLPLVIHLVGSFCGIV